VVEGDAVVVIDKGFIFSIGIYRPDSLHYIGFHNLYRYTDVPFCTTWSQSVTFL